MCDLCFNTTVIMYYIDIKKMKHNKLIFIHKDTKHFHNCQRINVLGVFLGESEFVLHFGNRGSSEFFLFKKMYRIWIFFLYTHSVSIKLKLT